MKRLMFCAVVCLLCACNATDDIGDAIDIIDGVPRKTLETERLGVNAFANDGRFGSQSQQFAEVKNTLGLGFVRVLFAWTDGVQPSPAAQPNFGFSDALVESLPAGVDAIIVATGLPQWMYNPGNWINGDPRRTFADLWIKKIARRYGDHPRIKGIQIWNEPNQPREENDIMGLLNNPANYVELLATASNYVREEAPGKLVLNAATTAINQNFPETLNYNKGMREAGALEFLDIWAIHYYGKQFENVVRDGGVEDFLNSLDREIWVTESGAQGATEQLAYVEQVFGFLRDHISRLNRIYYYQFTEDSPAASTYGLKFPGGVSDLYVHLQERNQ